MQQGRGQPSTSDTYAVRKSEDVQRLMQRLLRERPDYTHFNAEKRLLIGKSALRLIQLSGMREVLLQL